MLGSFMLSPTYSEMNNWIKLGHCYTFDHNSHNTIVQPEIPNNFGEIEEIVNHSDWIIGQLIYWWKNSNESQRALLRDFINQRLGYFPQRVLKQFT